MKSITKSKNLIRTLINSNNQQSEINNEVVDDGVDYEYEQEGLDNSSGNFVSNGNGIDVVLEEEEDEKTFFNHDPTPVEIVTPPFIPITKSKEDGDLNINLQNEQTTNTNQQSQTTNSTNNSIQSQQTSPSSEQSGSNTTSSNINNTQQTNTDTQPQQKTEPQQSIIVESKADQTNVSKREETNISAHTTSLKNNSSYTLFNYLYLVVFITLL
jgi:hypothetical protein